MGTKKMLRHSGKKTIFAILTILAILGCSREFDNPFDPNNSSRKAVYVKEGWRAYRTGEMGKAKDAFASALSLDDKYAEAYNGLGWCEFRSGNLSEASKAFSSAIEIPLAPFTKGEIIENEPTMSDAYAGLAGTSLAAGEYKSAVEYAALVLNSTPRYINSHDDSITYYQLRLILAEGYFQMGEYDKALQQVTLLNPDHKVVPENKSYLEDLALEIETLSQKQRDEGAKKQED
ncbi:MAG: tetratricopeptide repeat protein [Candidatus Poribacteria bacterium]